jgi:tetratricopeptide (TPR) repeat protein
VISLSPTHWTAHYNLGGVLTKLGNYSEASQCFSNLIHLDPARIEGYVSLAKIQSTRGDSALAAETLSTAAELHPRDAALRRHIAVLMEQAGARELAVSNFFIVAELNPLDAQAHYDLAIALARRGRNADAIEHFRMAISLNPEWVAPLNNLAWLLATAPEPSLRDGKEAVRLAAQACQMTNYKDPGILGTLDAAYAESGEFDKAIKTADSVCQLALASGKTNLLNTARARREQYLSGKPFHESRAARP